MAAGPSGVPGQVLQPENKPLQVLSSFVILGEIYQDYLRMISRRAIG
jgi:hypothetical protein